ncbi:Stage 0 sporulation protein KE [Piscirickettsia salmonis]|nr:Stage 0 sporulation protein KE [Piscirickettsia salmonis]QGP58326.1 Stage 0 sporulation protein KE [Piscirickettsia salmonis]QGP65375.1 Stage 0 sporulation protein KE [Piscirickettsia salmonis]
MMSVLLEVDNVSFSYSHQHKNFFKKIKPASQLAVANVTFKLNQGESLGVVGESGSGKSTLARLLVKLMQPDQGQIRYREKNIFSKAYRRQEYAKCVQLIFQDPLSSLNPRRTVLQTIIEVLAYYYRPGGMLNNKQSIQVKASELIAEVGLTPEVFSYYPHELSGGQRQRFALARALAVSPELLVADEVASALDVSVQAQIIQLMQLLLKERGLSLIFISHDLAVIQQLTTHVLVMFQGQIVESLPAQALGQAKHPYTQSLIKAIPALDPSKRHQYAMNLEVVSAVSQQGCAYLARCQQAQVKCQREPPVLTHTGGKKQQIACWYAD